jgi:hypothetical protein
MLAMTPIISEALELEVDVVPDVVVALLSVCAKAVVLDRVVVPSPPRTITIPIAEIDSAAMVAG